MGFQIEDCVLRQWVHGQQVSSEKTPMMSVSVSVQGSVDRAATSGNSGTEI